MQPKTNDVQTFTAASVTPMGNDHFTMLNMWRGLNPNIKTAELAANLQRRFKLEAGKAWILACRFKNELHTKANQ